MIDDKTLDELAKSNPELVRQYREKMSAPNAGVQSAQNMQDYGSIANAAGSALNAFGNANRAPDVVLHNSMRSLGSAPKVSATPETQYDGSALDSLTARGVSRAKDAQSQAGQDFQTEQKLTDMGRNRAQQDKEQGRQQKGWDQQDRESDPNSPESVQAREYLKQVAPSAASVPGFDRMSAAQVQKVSPGLFEKYKLDESTKARKEDNAQRSADRQAAAADRSADRAAMAGIRRDDRADEVARKDADYQASVKIPGLAVQQGYRPTPEAAKTVRSAKSAHDELTGALGQLDRLYKESGTNFVGDDSNTQAALISGMQAKLKDLESLGALSASDYALLSKQLPDPTSATENLKGMFGGDSYAARSKAFRDQLERSLQSTATNNGYQATGGPSKASGPSAGDLEDGYRFKGGDPADPNNWEKN
jgi:hypothetical protein